MLVVFRNLVGGCDLRATWAEDLAMASKQQFSAGLTAISAIFADLCIC